MSEANSIDLHEYARRMIDAQMYRSTLDMMVIDSDAVMADILASYGPLKREPRWRRMLRRCGDLLIRCGIALGGDTEDYR